MVKRTDKNSPQISPTEQYRERNIEITSGHESDLTKVPVPAYTKEEHETWALMFASQKNALPNMASREFLEALSAINLPEDRIPTLKEVSRSLKNSSGWNITRVGGLVPEKEFFECLAQKLFPCTDFIRPRTELEYTPSPDMFHDIFGHCPLVTNPYFASFYENFGIAALNANAEQLSQLQRIYWFTVEFGLIENPEGIRIYGSGILSSVGEVPYCLGPKVARHPFNFEVVKNQAYEIYHMQEDLFVVPSFEWLLDSFKEYLKKEKLL